MEDAKHYILATPSHVEAMEVLDMQGIASQVCKDPIITTWYVIRMMLAPPWLDGQLGTTLSVYTLHARF